MKLFRGGLKKMLRVKNIKYFRDLINNHSTLKWLIREHEALAETERTKGQIIKVG